MKKLLLFGLLLASLLMMLPSVKSVGPWTHVAIADEVCAESGSWPYKDLCCNQYKQACMFGLLETDRSVFHYITNFKIYQATHNWLTVDKCFQYARNNEEKAVCVGISLHEAMDTEAHNYFVPDVTKSWGIFSEALTHPFIESAIDKRYRAEYPNLEDETTMYLSDENIAKFCTGPDSIMNKASGLDSTWECGALAGAVSQGGIYQSVFLIGPVVNYAYKGFIFVAGFLPMTDWQPYEDATKKLTREAFQGLYPRNMDPSGYEILHVSQYGWTIVGTLIILIMSGYIIFRIIRFVRKRR